MIFFYHKSRDTCEWCRDTEMTYHADKKGESLKEESDEKKRVMKRSHESLKWCLHDESHDTKA